MAFHPLEEHTLFQKESKTRSNLQKTKLDSPEPPQQVFHLLVTSHISPLMLLMRTPGPIKSNCSNAFVRRLVIRARQVVNAITVHDMSFIFLLNHFALMEKRSVIHPIRLTRNPKRTFQESLLSLHHDSVI